MRKPRPLCYLLSLYADIARPEQVFLCNRAYRARAVREPRAVLAEFGTILAAGTELRVHDSTADLRYRLH